MSIERRKARSLIMKIIIRMLHESYDDLSFSDGSESNCQKLRQNLEDNNKKYKKRRGTVTKRKEIAGVPVEVAASTGCRNNDVIVFIHGGSYILGIAFHHRMYAETLAAKSGKPVIMIDYALAPEHPFPAGLDDCEKVYTAVREQRPDSRITLVGDSAGGGLCLSLLLRLKSKGIKLPDNMILHSPVIDLSDTIDRSINDDINTDFIVKKGSGASLADLYVGSGDTKDPEVSPYFGDYSGFPPTFITCDIRESLYADSITIDRKLEEAGVPVKTIEMDGAFHTYGTVGDKTIETRKITREIIDFIK